MSLTVNNGIEKKFQEEELFQLREIFDVLEGEKKIEDLENQNNPLIGKNQIKNIKNIKIIGPNPKNRYKLKLQKILFDKK